MGLPKSHLYVPADSARKTASAKKVNPGSIILDLEDGVAESQKALALSSVPESIEALGHGDVWVRVNSGARGQHEISQLRHLNGIAGIWIPKAEPGQEFDASLLAAQEAGLSVGVVIETAKGYLERNQLLQPGPVTRVQIGEYDLRGELGMAAPSVNNNEVLTGVRVEIIIAARGAGVDGVLAAVSSNFSDSKLYRASCLHMQELGFNGRACIHPSQVTIAEEVFSPSAQDLHWANETLRRYELETSQGRGVYRDASGEMADAATIRRASNILNRAN